MIKKKLHGKLKTLIVVGARPNFMKAAPLFRAMEASGRFDAQILHTGQHYDAHMSDSFFKDLELPRPHISLGIGSGTQAEQTAKIMLALETPLTGDKDTKPELVVVVGDVNSTLAATLTAKKLHIPVAHIEAGLRSFDEAMPEEINRVLTDHISDLLFTTEKAGNENLRKEGVSPHKVHFVGNVMIDSLLNAKPKIAESTILEKLKLSPQGYAVLTLHRPSNVDEKDTFLKIFNALKEIQKDIPIIFPIHPRTVKQINEFGLKDEMEKASNIRCIEPMGYLDFMQLMSNSKFVLTDSGGMQEETTVLGIPCLTLRNNTERPITVEIGTSEVVGTDTNRIIQASKEILAGKWKQGTIPKYWDGKASGRIVDALTKHFYES